jgi:hypothetical protein
LLYTGIVYPKGRDLSSPGLEAPSFLPLLAPPTIAMSWDGGFGQNWARERTGACDLLPKHEFGKVESVYGGLRGQVMW